MYRKRLLCYIGIHKKSKFVSEIRNGTEYAVCEHCGARYLEKGRKNIANT